MADAQDKKTGDLQELPALPAFPGREEDFLFKAQMTVANSFYGYWKHALAVLGLVLAAVFVWGTWQNHTRDTQRAIQAKVSTITRTLQAGLEKNSDNPDMIKAQAAEGARRLVAAGDDSSGAGATYAYLRAARAWTIAEDKDGELAAWEKAVGTQAPGELGWAATSGLASARFDRDDVDGAVKLLTDWVGQRTGYEAQRASFEAARFLELSGRNDDALAAYKAFGDRFPESRLAGQAAAALGRLGSNG